MNSEERDDTQAALERSTGYLRRQLGSALSLRVVPQLQFHYDSSIEDGARMSALIDEAVSSNTTDPDQATGGSPNTALDTAPELSGDSASDSSPDPSPEPSKDQPNNPGRDPADPSS